MRLTFLTAVVTLKLMPNYRLEPGVDLDAIFRALADPTRRAIVERLVRGPASVGTLAEPLRMSLPAVMQHLQVLQDAGLVASEKVGRVRTCRIESAMLRTAEAWLGAQRTGSERQLDRLGEHLAAETNQSREEP